MKKHTFLPVTGVDLKLTDFCNLRCTFCVNNDGNFKHAKVDVKNINRALKELYNAPSTLANLQNVFFTGGEPMFVLDYLKQIVDELPKEIFTSVVTNGIRMNEENLEKMRVMNINRIKVSYDTTDPKIFVKIRKGAKEEDLSIIEKNIKSAVEKDFLVFMRVALGKSNYKNLTAIYEKAMELGVDTLQIKPIVASGRAKENEQLITNGELMEVFSDLAKIYNDRVTKISVSCFTPAEQVGLPVKNCANKQKFYLNTDGDIFTCNYFMDPSNLLGNYNSKGGILEALQKRKKIYENLFTMENSIALCPSRLYLISKVKQLKFKELPLKEQEEIIEILKLDDNSKIDILNTDNWVTYKDGRNNDIYELKFAKNLYSLKELNSFERQDWSNISLQNYDFTKPNKNGNLPNISGAILKGTNAKINPQFVKNKNLYATNCEGLDLSQYDFRNIFINAAVLKDTNANIKGANGLPATPLDEI